MLKDVSFSLYLCLKPKLLRLDYALTTLLNMKKGILMLIVIAAIFVAILSSIYMSYFRLGPMATLAIDSGTVQFNSGNSWQDAKSGMTLKQGYSVKTLENSAAKIIFSDSVMRLDQNTEIAIDTLTRNSVSLSQIAGQTWNKLLKISGISFYEVKTPDAIATVRGTAFSVSIGSGTDIAVAEGNVSAQINGKDIIEIIEANKEVVINKEDNSINKIDIIVNEWITKNMQLDEQQKQAIKQRILEKYGTLINKVKSSEGMTDADIDQLLTEWIDGKHSIKQAIEDGTISSSLAKLIPAEFKRY